MSSSGSSSQLSLPDDVVFEILSRLPVKSLLRFRCVCKLWRNLISSDPDFLRAHLQNCSGNGGTIEYGLLNDGSIPPHLSCFSCRRSNINKVQEFTNGFSIVSGEERQWRLIFAEANFSFVGCCYGVVCFYEYCTYAQDIHIYLWNPALKQCGILPESEVIKLNELEYYYIMVNVLYDAGRDEYQVVKMVYVDVVGFYKAEIYSLRTNSWKPLLSVHHPHREEQFHNSQYWKTVVHKGLLHWLVNCDCVATALCVLDLNRKNIREISLPEEVYDHRVDAHLQIFQGCLSLFCGITWREADKMELWVMKEEGSWTKKFVVPGELKMELMLHRTTWVTAGNLLVAIKEFVRDDHRGGRHAVLYDPEKQRMVESRDDWVLQLPNDYYVVFDYFPSMVSLSSLVSLL